MGEDAPKGLATHRLRNMHVYESVGYSHNGSTHLAHRFVGCWPQVRNALPSSTLYRLWRCQVFTAYSEISCRGSRKRDSIQHLLWRHCGFGGRGAGDWWHSIPYCH